MRLFVVEDYVRLFLKTMYGYKREGAFQLHAFVVMPEHVHLLVTPTATLERAIQLLKGGYIHHNPVKRGLVENAWEYKYCSAFPGYRLDIWSPAAEAA